MIKVIIHGVNGYMGRVLTGLIENEEDMEVICGIDTAENNAVSFPVFTDIFKCDMDADVLIDFSVAKAIDNLVEYCEKKSLPAVICTTGLSDEQLEKVQKLSEKVAVLRSANMSLGVNTLMNILSSMSNVFTDAGFDVEIVEKHHNRKLDAPSGTAIALADSVNAALEEKYDYQYDRSSKREQRKKNEIGIVAVRGGNIVGEHEVIFAGNDEVITFKHTATSRGVFATGAIAAAKYITNKGSGLYEMKDVISGR